ncbi:SHOCT domain-containing protein [Virgibacillus halodenitrificans]|uniref:SHOCT domain-containing protein n=1 Tax=Virgibacillus halodenitrificans TaxID=1482 RepID=UPI001F41F0D7|nr:SHOCT domain-containing protein [Virgibacillus halodenitrificans]
MGGGIGCLGLIIIAIIFFSSALSGEISTGLVWFCIIGGIVASFGGLLIDSMRKGNLASELIGKMKETLNQVEDFETTQEYISTDRESMLAIDETNKKVCIINNKYDNVSYLSQTFGKYDYEYYVFPYQDILQSEILEDGVTITKTSRGSQIGGALLGGALAGGVGAIIGGLSGKTKGTNEVKKVQLQVVVNNTRKSFHRITFLSRDEPFSKDNLLYRNANKEITHWHNILSHIINRIDKEDKSLDNTNVHKGEKPVNLVANELKKLAELKGSGIITEEEFIILKKKLLLK